MLSGTMALYCIQPLSCLCVALTLEAAGVLALNLELSADRLPRRVGRGKTQEEEEEEKKGESWRSRSRNSPFSLSLSLNHLEREKSN